MKRLIFTAIIIFFLDWYTKIWVAQNIIPRTSQPLLPPYIVIHPTRNAGLILGIFSGNSLIVYTVIFIASLVLLSYAYSEIKRNGHTISLIGVGMITGGAVGNLVDRLLHGSVLDFIKVGSFPIFNVADSSIVTGVFLLALSYWIEEKWPRKPAETPAPEALQVEGEISPARESTSTSNPPSHTDPPSQ